MEKNSLERRNFLKLSFTAAIGGIAGRLMGNNWNSEATLKDHFIREIGRFPRRKLGYSQREVSIMIGAGDMSTPLVEAGAELGMNYWHKANRWMRGGAPDIIKKNREAHYCQVTVDRVSGDHYTGHFDEQEHYRYVKEAVKRSGLGYFDDMQLHYGYHNAEEVKKERGFIRAFERLKREGLVRHLCLSQHSYRGSSRVENGESDARVLKAVMEDGLYEHAQFMYSYPGDPEMDEFIEMARKKNFGTIAMKTARGIGRMSRDEEFMDKLPDGVSPYHAMARWLTTETLLDAAVIRVRNMEEFTDTYSGAGKKLRDKDWQALRKMTREANRTACRMCGKCQIQCPRQIPISDILRFERYAMDDNDWNKARKLYAGLPTKGNSCIGCESCMQVCPQNMRIPDKIARAHAMLG